MNSDVEIVAAGRLGSAAGAPAACAAGGRWPAQAAGRRSAGSGCGGGGLELFRLAMEERSRRCVCGHGEVDR